jgi:MFS family permease
VTSFGSYVVAANLPSYSKETGAGLIVIGFLIALHDLAEIFIKLFEALWLILVRLLQGAGAAFFSVMSVTLLIRSFMERKGPVLGVYGAFKNARYVLAPSIGGFFAYYHGFQSIFGLCFAVGLQWAFLMVERAGVTSLICLTSLKETRESSAVETGHGSC